MKQMKLKFAIGDVVQLVSGGPEMAISEVIMETNIEDLDCTYFDGRYHAQWFAGRKLERGVFDQDTLTLIRKVGT